LVLSAQPAPVADRVPVVIELFTSEGCSSCPPADSLLKKLAWDQGVPGADVIALGFHVTYWDRLGWKDPFSLPLATDRQQAYSRVFGEDRIYTPQAVIDGQDELVGSDEAGVRRAIANAAKRPHTRITLEPTYTRDGVSARITIPGVPPGIKEPLDLLFFVTEGGLTSDVKRGENRGRALQHEAVVRGMTHAGTINADAKFPFVTTVSSRAGEEHLRPTHPWLVIAVLQGQKTRRIWASGIR
jgi:hypothetical protein